MNIGKIAWEDLKKKPHKEDVDPKVEFVSFCSPKTCFPSLILVRQSSNQHGFVVKMTGSIRLNHKTGFSKQEHIFGKKNRSAICFNKTGVGFCVLS